MLEAGGTAADAVALAVASVLSVVEPYFSHVLGGETWGLYYEAATGEITAIDGVGTAGSLVTLEAYAPWYESRGMHQAIVPGGWDGWMVWLERFGRTSLHELLQPPVTLAREGFTASEFGVFIRFDEENVRNHPPTAEIYLIDGELVDSGQTLFNPDLADTFEALMGAFSGGAIGALNRGQGESEARSAGLQAARDYFYRGSIAEAMVAETDTPGNWFTLDDFANFEASIVPAILNWIRRNVSSLAMSAQ
ncbi:MAG: gamma-glutamyltransferase [Thermomicrobiales bacterium]